MRRRLIKGLVIPDCHHPAVFKPAWNCMLRAAKVLGPDEIIQLGDFADADVLSAHGRTRNPTHATLKSEAHHVNVALDQLDALGAKRKYFINGNHEWRLERYIGERAAALEGLVTWGGLLHLKDRGWHETAYTNFLRLGKMNWSHDTGGAGNNAHRKGADAFAGSASQGHNHHMAYEVIGRIGREPMLAATFGWLGDPDQIEYTSRAKAHRWSHGFGVYWRESDTGIVHVQPIPIINGKACIMGQLV